MKYTIYRCDYCNKVLSDKIDNISKSHITISIAEGSGKYDKDSDDLKGRYNDGWKRSLEYAKGVYQYCNSSCLNLGLLEQRKVSE